LFGLRPGFKKASKSGLQPLGKKEDVVERQLLPITERSNNIQFLFINPLRSIVWAWHPSSTQRRVNRLMRFNIKKQRLHDHHRQKENP